MPTVKMIEHMDEDVKMLLLVNGLDCFKVYKKTISKPLTM